MDFLLVQTPEGRNFCRVLGSGTIRIGRHPGNDLILEDPYVSRYQAAIVNCTDGYHLLPHEGNCGIFVNDRLIQESLTLHPGDQIRLGKSFLIFNASLPSPVEFIDRPLPPGSETTAFSLDDILTPTPEEIPIPSAPPIHQVFDPELAEGERFLEPLISQSSIGTLSSGAAMAILEADKELIFNRPLPEILEKIMDLMCRAIDFERGFLALLKNGELMPQTVRIPEKEAGNPILVSQSITNWVMKNKESILTNEIRKHQADAVQADDITLMILQRTP